jgi:hypothetical protein
MEKDEIVVAFMNSETRKRVPIPDEAVVITELLQGDMIVLVPQDEFLDWLLKH